MNEAANDYLPAAVVEPARSATAAVIWLHGLGADGHDFEAVVPHLGLPESLAVRFIFPHAPAIPVTINNGYVMPAWYDILEMNLERAVDELQLRASAAAVGRLVSRERERGIEARHIIIAGFSQGGAVAYELALSWPQRLGGLIALSTYFATASSIERHPANADLPVLICHGVRDPMVDERHGKASAERLTEAGYPVEYRTYPVEHGVALEEIADIGAWITARLG
ncbi:MAG: dienelactone hydrolase family protein [Gammaproteobacteria bacterium]